MNKNNLFSAVKLSQILIAIEVHKIRKIPETYSYKKEVIKALEKLFDFYNLEDISAIDDIYELEESKKALEDKYFNSLPPLDHKTDSYNSIEYAAEIHADLINFMSDKIYYVCCYNENKKYPGYVLEDYFYEVISLFSSKLDLPESYLSNLNNKLMSEKSDYLRKIRNIEDFPAYSWFEKKKEYYKEYDWDTTNNKKEVISYLKSESESLDPVKKKEVREANESFNDLLRKMRVERSDPENVKAKEYQDKFNGIVRAINTSAFFDKELNTFNSIGLDLFIELTKEKNLRINKDLKKSFIENEVSENISNENIAILLTFFKELGIKGSLIQKGDVFNRKGTPQGFIDRDGNKTYEKMDWSDSHLSALTIELGAKAKWNPDHNDILEKLLKSFDFNLSNLFYDNSFPILKL